MPYREDTKKKDQGRALLDEGSMPPLPNEDDPAIMIVTTPVSSKDGGSHKTLSK
jgi:hypothetical protein